MQMRVMASQSQDWLPRLVVGACVCFLLLYFLLLLISHDFDPKFLAIDGCLDDGGRWNYETRTCEGAR